MKRCRREKKPNRGRERGRERERERERKQKGNKSLLPGPSYILSKTGAHASVFTYDP